LPRPPHDRSSLPAELWHLWHEETRAVPAVGLHAQRKW
jgi:hypothetical protein